MRYYGDITKLKGSELPPVDVIVGGSPCQNLSVAGNRKGLEGSESRLFMEQIRIIKEMNEHGRNSGSDRIFPRFAVWENVVGAFSCNGGRDFQAVLTAFVRIVEPEAPDVPMPDKGWPSFGLLLGNGWSLCYRVHDAQHWGVPQRRRRIALVMDLAGGRAGEVQTLAESLSGHHKPGKSTRKEAAVCSGMGTAVYGGEPVCLNDHGGSSINVEAGNNAPTLRANSHQHEPVIAYSLVDAGEPVCIGFGWDGTQVAGTFTVNNANGSQRMPDKDNFNCVIVPSVVNIPDEPVLYDMTHANDVVRECGSISPTLQNRMGTGGNQVSLTVEPRWIVRRLTPMECERLQGFPDGWSETGIMADGTEKQMSDSTRYKLQGNSIALPYWTFLMRRISAEFEHTPTLGSLFDGQGGFPLIWGRINGQESVLWSSEIDKNAEAVVRKHFGDEDTGLKGDFYEAIQKQFVRY